MNARQKAKHYKRLYNKLREQTDPRKPHFTQKETLRKYTLCQTIPRYYFNMAETSILEKKIVTDISEKMEPIIAQNLIRVDEGERSSSFYLDVWMRR